MSLGMMTKDSVVDLMSLGKVKQEADDAASGGTATTSNTVSTQEGDLSEVAVGSGYPEQQLEQAPPTFAPSSITTPPKTKTHQYAGFTADYADYEKYGGVIYHDSDAPQILLGAKQGGGLWCCLFPWLAQPKLKEADVDADHDSFDIDATDEAEQEAPLTNGDKQQPADSISEASSVKSDDDVSSTASEQFGAKLTEKEQAAVLARLRLAAPEVIEEQDVATPLRPTEVIPDLDRPNGGCLDDGQEADNVEADPNAPKEIKSILRRGSALTANSSASLNKVTPGATMNGASSASSQAKDGNKPRRSLFPQQYESKAKSHDRNVNFAPMARVVTVKSKHDMTEFEKSLIWWQKHDYDDFKKTGRIIAKAMCQGGSEIWLASNNSWQQRKVSPRSTTESLSERKAGKNDIQRRGSVETSDSDKWWHKFGHSRRGLEHIASVEEGRQRQTNVRVAIRAVIDEQRRQKVYRKEDPEKIRMLSLQYTTWSRDLSHAAAASDAEAVQVNFNETRKSREFFLLKHARATGGFNSQTPSFMRPVGVSPQMLDRHTSTQIRYRRIQTRVTPVPIQPKALGDEEVATNEAVHDQRNGNGSMAKNAAGFGTEGADVSRILSGMGTVDDRSKNSKKSVPMAALKPQLASVGAH